jgi:TonB family protein
LSVSRLVRIASALMAALILQAQTSRVDEIVAQERKMSLLAREGYKLTKEQAAFLEQVVARMPDDLDGRAKLMGYYFGPGSQSLGAEARIQARRRHILWLIHNHPDSALLMTSESTIDPGGSGLADPEGYDQARKAWIEQTAKKEASAFVLGNAGRFLYHPDKALAIQFYARARKLNPENVMWVKLQGSVLAFAVVGITAMNQNGLPGPADPAEARSEVAKSVRRELDTTKDTALMTAAAGELMARGLIAQSMARGQTGEAPLVDALGLAESLLKRVQELDPGNSDSSAGLARISELRGMSATSGAGTKAAGGGTYRLSGSNSGPRVISKKDPDYSAEARKAGAQSTIVASLMVTEDGFAKDIRVTRGGGFGLDEQAIEAIGTWRFTPGMKEGRPVAVKANVEVNFRLSKKGHENQIARLNFTLAQGASRPELISGEVPANPSTPGDQSLRIRLEVSAEGLPQNFNVLESTDSDWENTVLRELRSWRFRPAMVNGRGVLAEGVFELMRGSERAPVPSAVAAQPRR